jgi:hypothetical protein
MPLERRKYPRFSVRDNAFVLFQPEPVKLASIVDVSLGGLAIGVRGTDTDTIDEKLSCLEILIDDCSFYIDNLGYELLPRLRSVPRSAVIPFQNIYGLKFVNLVPSQLSRLKSFIRNHTTGGRTPKLIRKFNQHFHQFFDKRGYGAACRNINLQHPHL